MYWAAGGGGMQMHLPTSRGEPGQRRRTSDLLSNTVRSVLVEGPGGLSLTVFRTPVTDKHVRIATYFK